MSPAQVRREVNDYISTEKEKTETKAKQLLNGTISLTSFFMYLKSRIEAWHSVSGAIAYGGKAQLDPERNARIKERIKSELKYLTEFQKQARKSFEAARKIASQVSRQLEAAPIKSFTGKLTVTIRAELERKIFRELIEANPSEAERVTRKAINEVLEGLEAQLVADSLTIDESAARDLIGATIPSRAAMYADAAYSTFQNNEAAREFDSGVTLGRRVCEEDMASCDSCADAADSYFVPLDELPEIGSLDCMCITTPHSRVVTDRGWVPIGAVEVGDQVWTHKGRWRRVTDVIVRRSNPEHKFVLAIAPMGQVVGFTSDHRLLTEEGWVKIGAIQKRKLSVYNWCYELLRKLRLTDAEKATRCLPLPPMPWDMPLREQEGLASEGMPVLRHESQSQDPVGYEPRSHVNRIAESAQDRLQRSAMGLEVAAEAGRRSILHRLLGRGADALHLPLPVGMDQSQRPDTQGLPNTPQEPRPILRSPLELGNEDRARAPRTSQGQAVASVRAERKVSDMRNDLSSQEAFSYEATEILQQDMLRSPAALWDISVADDHSFIVEGLVSHNSNCRCFFEYAEPDALTLDAGPLVDRLGAEMVQ